MSSEAALRDLEQAWRSLRSDPGFVGGLRRCLARHAGRPTPLTRAEGLAAHLGGGLRIYLKREDLVPAGTQEINVCLGQALLARHLGKTRLVIATGAGRHGVAAASAAAALKMACVVYLAGVPGPREAASAALMRLMGARLVAVTTGDGSPEEADREARRDWSANAGDTYYLPGPRVAEPPYPSILRDFQSVVGHEARSQMLEAEGRMPDSIVASEEDGWMGLFQAFLDDRQVRLFRVAGDGRHADPGVAAEIAVAPLDARQGADRIVATRAAEEEAFAALRLLAKTEGIVPSLESARALALVARQGPPGEIGRTVLLAVSGPSDEEILQAEAMDAGVDRERRRT